VGKVEAAIIVEVAEKANTVSNVPTEAQYSVKIARNLATKKGAKYWCKLKNEAKEVNFVKKLIEESNLSMLHPPISNNGEGVWFMDSE